MTPQEILQLKIISLQQAQGDPVKALPVYSWLIEKTDSNGIPLPAKDTTLDA